MDSNERSEMHEYLSPLQGTLCGGIRRVSWRTSGVLLLGICMEIVGMEIVRVEVAREDG